MIYGVVAASDINAPIASPSSNAPDNAIGWADFVNGDYFYNTTQLTAADIVDHTDWIGASGLSVPGTAAAGAEIIYADLTTRLATCQWTAVFELEILHSGASTPDDRSFILTAQNAGAAYYIQISFCNEWEGTANNGSGNPFAYDDVHSLAVGIHKFAVTRIDSKMVISVDGNAVESDSTSCALPVGGFPMVSFFLGGWPDSTMQAINIRSFAILDAVADVALPGLST